MSKKWWILTSVACGTFMATLDSSIVNIALPTMTKALNADLFRIKWVVIVYLLALTCLLLPFGRLSDQLGRKPVFQLGFLIFILGSALCGFSYSLSALIFFRALQAVGASMLMVNGPAIITAAFPTTQRGTALGTLAMVVSAGLISGPSIGGMLIGHFGWRSIFWVNIPIGLLGMALVYSFVKKDPVQKTLAPFDWVGAFLQMLLLMSFIVVFDPPNVSMSGSNPLPVSRWFMAGVALVFGAAFLKVESEAKAPLLDMSLLKNRVFWTANLASFLIFVSFSAVSVLMPFFLEEIMNFPPEQAGLFMTSIPLMIFIIAPLSGRLSDQIGGQELSFAGAFAGAIGLLIMSGTFGFGIHDKIGNVGMVAALASIGLSMGLFQSPNNNAIMGAVPLHKLGVASALLATVRNLGLVTGTGLATALFTWRLNLTGDFISAFHFTLFVAALVSIGAMIASFKGRPLGKPAGS